MEFPEDMTTNTYFIDQVTEIHWSRWSHTQTQNVPFLQNSFRSQLATVSMLHELRKNHAHAFHDADIWLFDFSTSLGREFDESLLSHGYTELSRGSLNAADSGLLDPSASMTLGSGSTLSTEPVSNRNAPRSTELYKKAMSALCTSLCHSFVSGKSDEWMPLKNSSCIDMSTVGNCLAQVGLDGLTTNKINFESFWDMKGCLALSASFSKVERLCQVGTVLHRELQPGTSVLLLPSGTVTRYRGRLQEMHSDLIQSSKSQCVSFLNSQELFLSTASEWILVEIDRDRDVNEACMTIWPAEYAFFKIGDMASQSQDLDTRPEIDSDPFARAETWYLGRTARAAEVELIQGEIELQAQQKLSQRDISEPDLASEIASPAFREILAPQDVSGIYPTPPDGLLSQTPASNIHQEPSPGFATSGRTDHPSGYGDGANEDLFDDMEMDLVGEADFNFFDEPGNQETPNEPFHPDEMSEVAHADVPSLDPTANLRTVTQTQPHAESRDAESEVVAGGEDLPFESNDLEMGKKLAATSPFHENQEIPVPRPQTQEKITPARGNRGSFNPVSLAKLDFEVKYGTCGRFGCMPPDDDSFKSQSGAKHEIFQIGTQADGGESLSSDNDEEDLPVGQPDLPFGYDINEDLKSMSGDFENQGNGNIDTPESSMEADEEVKLKLPPSEIFFPRDHQNDACKFFRPTDPPKAACTPLGPSLFIEAAQLVRDQSSSWEDSSTSFHEKANIQAPPHLQHVISVFFPSARPCQLIDLVNSEDGQVVLTKGPAIGIQRYGTLMDISSPAIQFWEKLSLSPRSGPKNLNAFCVFSMKDYLVRPVKTFLEMMRGIYQDCNLGKHTLGDSQSPFPHGLVPVPNSGLVLNEDVAIKFMKHILSLRLTGGNTVIYMLNNGGEGAIPEMCHSFLALFYGYRKALEKEDIRDPNDFVLQIVATDMVFSSDQLVSPSPKDYKRLAFQVYDRCALSGSDGQMPFVCAPAISLAEFTPQPIDFKFTVDSSRKRDSLHLAYKWEPGQQWLSAVWTNNSGTIQWNAAFWLSEDENVETSLPQAAKGMLETTEDIIKSQRLPYHVYILKDGPFEDHESEMWIRLNVSEMSISLLEIDLNPSLVLFSPRNFVSSPLTSDFRTLLETTPYTGSGGLSPEVSAHILTPGGTVVPEILENDPGARLIDVTDDTWIMVTDNPNHALNIFHMEFGHSLPRSTGYLLKRAGTQNEDGILLLKINVIHDSEPKLLRMQELLIIYRNLALLARLRNVSDPVKGILPIHVATARGAYLALCRAMPFGRRS